MSVHLSQQFPRRSLFRYRYGFRPCTLIPSRISQYHECQHFASTTTSASTSTHPPTPTPIPTPIPTPTPAPPATRKKVTTIEIQKMYDRKQPITMVTAYTYPSAVHVDAADIDILLVGDSVAMVELGHNTTLPVSMDEMLYHAKAVSRGARRPCLVGDMPFGSYESDPREAYKNAIRFLKEAGMDAVKVEGGRARAETIKMLVDGGVAVMGHIGLTPQRISVLGGFRAQGRTLQAARELVADARALQAAGCFAIVIECVPAVVAEAITAAVDIPTIGIGAGPHVSGQVLVYHDLLGMLEHAHHAKVAPSFCKTYTSVGHIIQGALEAYRQEVQTGVFPGEAYSPYKMLAEDASTTRAALMSDVTAARAGRDEYATTTQSVFNPIKYATNLPPEQIIEWSEQQKQTMTQAIAAAQSTIQAQIKVIQPAPSTQHTSTTDTPKQDDDPPIKVY